MSTQPLKLQGLISVSNAAVWQNYKDLKCQLPFTDRSLIYGFNGSGKTTLSRVFSSIERCELEPELPSKTDFVIELSDGSIINSSKISNPFSKNLLVFNQDFIARNFQWDQSTVQPIFFLSEESIEKKKELEEAGAALQKLSNELEIVKNSESTAEKAFRDFKTEVARRVRDFVPGQKFTQSFDARKIESAYSNEKYSDKDLISVTDQTNLQRLLTTEEPLPKIKNIEGLSAGLAEWIVTQVTKLGESPGTVMAEEFSVHPEAMQWVKEGFSYHDTNSLATCLLCGNLLNDERKKILAKAFDTSWNDFVDNLSEGSEECKKLLLENRVIREALPSENDIQHSERAEFLLLKKTVVELLNDRENILNSISDALGEKLKNPSTLLSLPPALEGRSYEMFQSKLEIALSKLNKIIERHNNLHNDFSDSQSNAFASLRDHILSNEQSNWNNAVSTNENAKKATIAVERAVAVAEEKFGKLNDELRTHSKGAEQLNNLLASYLGHSDISLKSMDAGYQLIRGDGKPATQLSEGERTALAFCYFLTQFQAEGRNRKELILVIDDPISSLDTTARTHAFSLLHRMTKNCAQVIVLTHNMSFMNMVKRSFSKRDDNRSGLFFLDCKSSADGTSNRQTSLIRMPTLLADYDTEYQYLFSIVLNASEADNSQYYYLLPNTTRKLLEIFTRFAAPDKESFADALLGGGVELVDHDIKSLERLIQIESHGTIEGMSTLPSLTIEESLYGAKAAIAYIKKRDKGHFEAMKRLYDKHTNAGV